MPLCMALRAQQRYLWLWSSGVLSGHEMCLRLSASGTALALCILTEAVKRTRALPFRGIEIHWSTTEFHLQDRSMGFRQMSDTGSEATSQSDPDASTTRSDTRGFLRTWSHVMWVPFQRQTVLLTEAGSLAQLFKEFISNGHYLFVLNLCPLLI